MVDYVYLVYPVSLVYDGLYISCISSILSIWFTMYIVYIQYPWRMADYVYPVYLVSLVYGDYVYPVYLVSLVYGDYVYPVYPVSLVYG